MSSNSALQRVQERGWRSGFGNMLRKENSLWWGTRKWWVQSIVWLLIANGLVAFLLWAIPAIDPGGAPPVQEVLVVFVNLFAVSAAIGVMILTQSVIVGEKRSGTAAWIASNPVSRVAFILAKLVAHGMGILIILVGLQGLVAYLQLSLRGDAFLPALPFIGAMGLLSLNLLFYLTLSLMLGSLFQSRGPVIGISIAVLILQDLLGQILGQVWPRFPELLPGMLPGMAQLLAQELPLPTFRPIISVSLMLLLFLAVAIWRFTREEF